MSVQSQDKFILRLPDGMRDEIKAAALLNERSMNAEIVNRLSGTQANLRDQIAMHIASGMAAFSGTAGMAYGPGSIAARSYEIADMMLAERAKGGA